MNLGRTLVEFFVWKDKSSIVSVRMREVNFQTSENSKERNIITRICSVLCTECLVCRRLLSGAPAHGLLNEPREFLPSGCFLNQVCEAVLGMNAR